MRLGVYLIVWVSRRILFNLIIRNDSLTIHSLPNTPTRVAYKFKLKHFFRVCVILVSVTINVYSLLPTDTLIILYTVEPRQPPPFIYIQLFTGSYGMHFSNIRPSDSSFPLFLNSKEKNTLSAELLSLLLGIALKGQHNGRNRLKAFSIAHAAQCAATLPALVLATESRFVVEILYMTFIHYMMHIELLPRQG